MKEQKERTVDKNPVKEHLVTEAMRLHGQILIGKSQTEIMKNFLLVSPGDATERMKLIAQVEDGFVTSTGRFLRQDDAIVIAKAAGQIVLFGSLLNPAPAKCGREETGQ